jgi:uncharacterized protein
MYDLVEWAAAQPWSDGNVGMLGISYFAMTQLEAAVEQPPHLKAIFPLEATIDLYESANHNGLMSSSFITSFLAMISMTSGHTNKLWRSHHQLRLVLASDDQDPKFPAMMLFRHASVGTSSINRIASSSRLLLPVAAGQL